MISWELCKDHLEKLGSNDFTLNLTVWQNLTHRQLISRTSGWDGVGDQDSTGYFLRFSGTFLQVFGQKPYSSCSLGSMVIVNGHDSRIPAQD